MLRVAEQAFRSDTGRQRTANEDSLYARAPMFAVADGMGGAQAGEVASKLAADEFEPAERGDESAEGFLRSIAEAANERIHTLAASDSSVQGMGTTLTAALVDGNDVSFAHVGDSRAYVYRDGELKLLTSDHSLVEELRRQGRLTESQAAEHPQRSIITRALGPEPQVEVDTLTWSGRPGDVFLLCSDGLTTMVKDDAIAETLAGAENLDQAVTTLVRAANEAGGRDNITVVAFRLDDAEAPVGEDQPTLIGPSSEEAEISGERVRAAAARRESQRRGAHPPERRRWKTVAKALAAAAVIAAIVLGAWYGARQVYFLGTDEGGRLTLYRGLPYDLPLDISLYSEVYSVPVQVASLPEDRRDEAINHELRGHDDAISLLDDLESNAATPTAQPSEPPAQNANQDAGAGTGNGNQNPPRDEGGKQGGNDDADSGGGGGGGTGQGNP